MVGKKWHHVPFSFNGDYKMRRRLFTNSSAKATWSADNGFFTCLVSMAECCICKEGNGQVACPKSCRQAGLMHLTCILNYIDTTAVPKCPACRCQLPAWVVGSWREMAANWCIGGNSGQHATSRALTLKLKPPETKAPTPQPQKKKKKAKLTSAIIIVRLARRRPRRRRRRTACRAGGAQRLE